MMAEILERSLATQQPELTILIPCLDEAETIGTCVEKAFQWLDSRGVNGEVLVADNGSTDGSQAIASSSGATVIEVHERGYGAALSAGIQEAKGRFTVMGDADDSYDFLALDPFLERLRQGWHLVMGNRFGGGIAPGAMPLLHRYLGNPVLSRLGRILFPSPVRDFQCGLRGFDTAAIRGLGLRTTGMEFASEMVVKSTLAGLLITEVPTTLSPDGRTRAPHLRSWSDGWRHLKFLLVYSPLWLFLYPGLLLMGVGLVGVISLIGGERRIESVTFGIHTLLYSCLALIVGFEAVEFARFLKYLGARTGELPRDRLFAWIESVATLERSLTFGFFLMLAGLAGSAYALLVWSRAGFGAISPVEVMRVTIPSVTAIILGMQCAFSGFFMYAMRFGPGCGRD
jgi:glycosyltransferase involved in cell wall biosynthesis